MTFLSDLPTMSQIFYVFHTSKDLIEGRSTALIQFTVHFGSGIKSAQMSQGKSTDLVQTVSHIYQMF